MSKNQVVRAWEEVIISQEKGNRIVHYILKDSTGNSVLAVVGKDRCVNHMSYSVSEDYLHVFGPSSTVHTGTKWQARRDVVNWLVWVASRGGPILVDSTNPSSLKSVENAGASDQPEMRNASKRIKIEGGNAGHAAAVLDDPVVKCEPNHKTLKIEKPNRGSNIINLVMPGPRSRGPSKFDKHIELLSQDSGLQGCWFRCKILHSSQDLLKVRYKDVMQVDGLGKVEDWVRATRVAARDSLGMRRVGRLTVRPSACENPQDATFDVGAAVDAWWCNGWWEGVVIGCDTIKRSSFQLYLPGENRFLTVARKNVRISRDWVDGRWVNIEPKPDIISPLSSIFSSGSKAPLVSISAEAYSSTVANGEVLNPWALERSKDDKHWAVDELNLKRRLLRRYNEETSRRNSRLDEP